MSCCLPNPWRLKHGTLFALALERVDNGIEIGSETLHASRPGSASRTAVPHICGLDAAIEGGEVAFGVVADHEHFLRLEPHLLQVLEIVDRIGFAARRVLHGGDALERDVVESAPAHAAFDTGGRKARVGEERDTQAAIDDRLERLMGAFARARAYDGTVFERQDLALVVIERLENNGIVEVDAAIAQDALVEELAIGAVVGSGAHIAVECVHGAREPVSDIEGALAADAAHDVRDICRPQRAKRREIDAEQGIVHVENDGFEQNGSDLTRLDACYYATTPAHMTVTVL